MNDFLSVHSDAKVFEISYIMNNNTLVPNMLPFNMEANFANRMRQNHLPMSVTTEHARSITNQLFPLAHELQKAENQRPAPAAQQNQQNNNGSCSIM